VLAIPFELQNIDVIDTRSDLILTVALKGADYQTVNAVTDLISSGNATLAKSRITGRYILHVDYETSERYFAISKLGLVRIL
jgi:hypothetical protein